MTENEVEIEKPKNTVMKILIGILVFVFVGIPVLSILGLTVIGMIVSSFTTGNFEELENQPGSNPPLAAPVE